MKVREFCLVNEKGEEYSFMNLKNYCFLSSPEGLGYSYSAEYERLGTTFIENIRNIEKSKIHGTVNFLNYDNYKKLIDFIEMSEKLKISYKIPLKNIYKQYYKDVNIKEITKTEKKLNGLISETIVFDCLSLWYEQNETVYTISKQTNEIRWDFKWDSKFTSYNNRTILFENMGHTEAPFLLEIDGYLINPTISIFVNGKEVNKLLLNTTIAEYEKLFYSTKDNDLYIVKQNVDGTRENLFNILDINNNNFFKMPKGVSEIRISADNEIISAKLTIYVEYKVV